MPHDHDYPVGYRKPPVHSRFKPGRSGNPKGRPRRSKNTATLFDDALDEKVTVTLGDGRRCTISKREAVYKALINRALKGDHRATQEVLRHDQETAGRREEEPAKEPSPPPRRSIMLIVPDNGRRVHPPREPDEIVEAADGAVGLRWDEPFIPDAEK